VKHLDEEASWMPLRRDSVGVSQTSNSEVRARFLSQAGVLAGLEGLPSAPVVELTPVGTLSRASDLGLTAKAALTSSVTADLAVNPDFAEVEADQPQVTANQRFPLFFEEKRPFFLEGADVLRTPIQVFHSRTIVDPMGALKLAGRRGRTAIAALVAADAAPGHFSREDREDAVRGPEIARFVDRKALAGALRVRRDIGERSSLGLIGTTSSFVDRKNHVFGVDGRVGLSPSIDWTFQALGTSTNGAGKGFGYLTELAKTSSRLTVQLSGEGYSPDYRADLGFTLRTDTNRWSAFTRYNAPPAQGGAFVSWSALHTTLAQFDWRGRLQYAYLYPRLVLSFKKQTFVNLAAYRDYLRVFEEEFGPDSFAGPSSERSTVYHGVTVTAGTAPSRVLSLQAAYDRSWNNLDFDLGAGPRYPRVSPGALLDARAPLDPGPATSDYAMAGLVFQPAEEARIAFQYERQRLRRHDTGRLVFDQHLASLRGQYALSRFAWVRARLDRDSLDGRTLGQLTVGWTPRPGSAIYAGFDETGLWDGYPVPGAGLHRGYVRKTRTVFLKASWSARFRLGARKADGDLRTSFRPIGGGDLAPVALHDALHDGEAQARPSAPAGEEGLEH
jgi:hypothetical protein